MMSDSVLKCEGMKILTEHLGLIEAERFVTLVLREPFDYTEWQRNLFDDIPLEQLLHDAAEYQRKLDAGEIEL